MSTLQPAPRTRSTHRPLGLLPLLALVGLASFTTVAVSEEATTEMAVAPVCDEDTHRDGAHEPVAVGVFQECMGLDSEAASWSQCHHADFNCDGVVGIPDFNLFRSAVSEDDEGA
jgi:hypothetical protein